MLSAAATAAPPDEPPGVSRVSHGLAVAPKTRLSVMAFHPNSGVLVLPRITAPASRSMRAGGESRSQGASDTVNDPLRAGKPTDSVRSFNDTGIPSIALSGRPCCQRLFDASAAVSAPSRSTST